MKGMLFVSLHIAVSAAFLQSPVAVKKRPRQTIPTVHSSPQPAVRSRIFKNNDPSNTSTTGPNLSMLSIGASDVAASAVLAGSSLAGCLIERRVPNTGILTTMALAAFSSSFPLVPSRHFLYDLCWTLFLPASLAFLLLSKTDIAAIEAHSALASTKDVIWDVSVPFVLASVGSIVGCSLTFLVCRIFPRLWLNPPEAALAASCLCASFIGGTVNFFATARVIARAEVSTLMGAMAAADTFVMAVYFAGMAVALKSTYLAGMFREDASTTKYTVTDTSVQSNEDLLTSKRNDNTPRTMAQRLTATTLVTALAMAIVKFSSNVERHLSPILPGTACASIAIVSLAIERTLSKQSNALAREMQCKSRNFSEFTLQLFFASIGKSADLGEALLHGPACICFSLLALVVHILIAFGGSMAANRTLRLRLQLEDVLVASNAAVGGPATAAAFAGRMKSSRQRGLTMAGTVWGVVGYAVGTTIGVALHSVFLRYL